jgi:hypothetical protein
VARELIHYCDMHFLLDERVEGTTRHYDAGFGVREIELCDECHEKVAGDLAGLLAARGRTVEVDTGLEKLNCTFCSRKLTTAARLAKHVDDQHPEMAATFINSMIGRRQPVIRGELESVSEAKPDRRQAELECDVCGKVCGGPQGLAAHKKWHQNTPVECPECDISIGSAALPAHLGREHGIDGAAKAAKKARAARAS